MKLSNCSSCGDLFASERFEICPKCRQLENDQVDRLKRYVIDNPDATMDDLVEHTAVPRKQIEKYVRQNKLLSVDAPALSLVCEGCGTKIESGRFCRKCTDDLRKGFASSSDRLRK